MRYRPLGTTGVLVSELSLGTMTFGSRLGATSGVDQERASELGAAGLEAGVARPSVCNARSTHSS